MAQALRLFDDMARFKRDGSVPAEHPPGVSADRERVALRAYEFYVLRGRADGHDKDDWLMAERELTAGLSLDEDEPDGES